MIISTRLSGIRNQVSSNRFCFNNKLYFGVRATEITQKKDCVKSNLRSQRLFWNKNAKRSGQTFAKKQRVQYWKRLQSSGYKISYLTLHTSQIWKRDKSNILWEKNQFQREMLVGTGRWNMCGGRYVFVGGECTCDLLVGGEVKLDRLEGLIWDRKIFKSIFHLYYYHQYLGYF